MCLVKSSTLASASAASAIVILAGALVANNADQRPESPQPTQGISITQDADPTVEELKRQLDEANQAQERLTDELHALTSGKQDGGIQQDEMDQDEMMEAWMNANKTGEHHRMLDDIIGTFDADMTMVNGPGMPPEKSNGTVVNKWVLDGRYVQTDFSMNFGGMEFNGLGFTAYSNADKQFQGIWMDSMSTTIEFSTGSAGADGKSMTMEATSKDPMTGMRMRIVETFQIESKDKHTFTRTSFSMDGQTELNSMTIVYTRKE